MNFLNWHDPSSIEGTMSRNTETTYGLINGVADLFNDLTSIMDDNSYPYNWNYSPFHSSKIEKTEEGYRAEVELPGYNKDTLNIKVENNVMTFFVWHVPACIHFKFVKLDCFIFIC